MAGVKPKSGPVGRISTPEETKMTRNDVEAGLVRFLASVIVVVAIWSGLTLLGIKPIGKSPSAALVGALVSVVGMSIFGLRQELQGRSGIGWLGATITGAAVVSASIIVSALSGH
jgi:hypothetical protein